MSVKIDDFSILLLVDSTRSFSEAAKTRHTTQQSISARIKKLEGQFGCSLFERTNQGVRLTPAGRRLVPYARKWLALYEETLKAARDDQSPSGLEVCAQESVRPILQALLGPGLAAVPFQLDYLDVPGADLLRRLENYTIDLAVGAFGAVPPGVVLTELVAETVTLAVAPSHPLAEQLGAALPDLPTWKASVQAAYRRDDTRRELIDAAVAALSPTPSAKALTQARLAEIPPTGER